MSEETERPTPPTDVKAERITLDETLITWNVPMSARLNGYQLEVYRDGEKIAEFDL